VVVFLTDPCLKAEPLEIGWEYGIQTGDFVGGGEI